MAPSALLRAYGSETSRSESRFGASIGGCAVARYRRGRVDGQTPARHRSSATVCGSNDASSSIWITGAHLASYTSQASISGSTDVGIGAMYSAPFAVEQRYPSSDRRLMGVLSRGAVRILHLPRASHGVSCQRPPPPLLPRWSGRTGKQNLTTNFLQRFLEERDLLEEVILGDASEIGDYFDLASVRDCYYHFP